MDDSRRVLYANHNDHHFVGTITNGAGFVVDWVLDERRPWRVRVWHIPDVTPAARGDR